MTADIRPPFVYRLRTGNFSLLALLVATLMLGACSSIPDAGRITDKNSANWQRHFNHVFEINSWYARSKIAVKTVDQGFSGHLSWQQNPDSYEIDFVGPMGIGLMKISGNPQTTSLMIPDKPLFSGASPEQLLQNHTGYQLPVSQLYFWARGIPNPKLAFEIQLNPSGQLKRLQQLGWNIEYLNYHRYQHVMLPGKIVIKKGAIKIKLVRLDWQAINSTNL
ncbi:MAG: lipoprotein insertase outer membrane protein LolB [Pseudomonadales bacterium]|nr:lipoprotein insertase outer membrane protein LolB [Pseudomonadales bacterium]